MFSDRIQRQTGFCLLSVQGNEKYKIIFSSGNRTYNRRIYNHAAPRLPQLILVGFTATIKGMIEMYNDLHFVLALHRAHRGGALNHWVVKF